MAEQFQQQSALHPDLTLEDFTIRHGIRPDQIRRFIRESQGLHHATTGRAEDACDVYSRIETRPEWVSRFVDTGDTTSLWHGTTAGRAREILAEGFRGRSKARKKIWFTRNPSYARRMAIHKARERAGIPVVISCQIDLDQHEIVAKPTPATYVFYAQVSRQVIRSVCVVNERRFRTQMQWKKQPESIGVKVTQPAEKSDISSWINQYLGLEGKACLSTSHPAVEAIYDWVAIEYATGRQEPISDGEMASLVMILRGISRLEMGGAGDSPSAKGDTGDLVDVTRMARTL